MKNRPPRGLLGDGVLGWGRQARSLRGAVGVAGSCSSRLCARGMPGTGLRGKRRGGPGRGDVGRGVVKLQRSCPEGFTVPSHRGGTEGLCSSAGHGECCPNPPSHPPHTPALCIRSPARHRMEKGCEIVG